MMVLNDYVIPNAYGYEKFRNRAEISLDTVTAVTATVQKKVRNRTG